MQPDKSDLPAVQPARSDGLHSEDVRAISRSVMSETTNVLNPIEHKQLKIVAQDFWNSGAISDSFQNVEQVVMALVVGREIGLSFNESMNGLYFVRGKLNIYGKATPRVITMHDWLIKYVDETQETCTAILTDKNTGYEITDTFTFQEAEQSGFTKDNNGKLKAGWLPGIDRKRKLRYGVLSLIIHTYIPEVLGGASGIGDYSQDYYDSADQDKNKHKLTQEQKDQNAADAKKLAGKRREDAAAEAETL